ncbi:MAG: hypothetical protein K2P39_07040 [Lachnospiraceae bacterium]|nr:hypothetical protein [Lachnospiraceae bacterium]MDE7030253.1 hypothetical protein [Lachnospiraceae bacterium]
MKIFCCKECGALDYAETRCSKCGSARIDEADIAFLTLESSVIPSPVVPVLFTNFRLVEKNGWN